MEIKTSKKIKGTLFVPYYEAKGQIKFFSNQTLEKEILNELNFFNFSLQEKETKIIKINNDKICLFYINEKFDLKELNLTFQKLINLIKKEEEITFNFENFSNEKIQNIIESIFKSTYKFDKYLSKKEEKIKTIININTNIDIKKSIFKSKIISQNTSLTKDLVNENSNIITPIKIENIAKEFAKKNKLKIKTLNEKQIEKEKLNLLLAVGNGSSNKPRLIIIEYNGDKSSKEKTALVGKGITFDTGGTNLKPTGFIEDMKSDMGGAATLFGAFKTAVELKLKRNLILVLPCAENSISSNSYKPGDVYKSYSGKTIEILNTDAEGRLVLADALEYVQKNYKPTKIIDMATLTGACLVALGPTLIAMLGNDKKMKNQIFQSGELTNERVWELPIYDEHKDLIKSKIADMKNIGGKYGGAITAGAFIQNFIEEDIKWVHLDIAGAAWDKQTYATGKGIKLIINYLENN